MTADGNLTDNFGTQYCRENDIDGWTPLHIRNWSTATSAQVADEVFSSAGCFFQKSMVDADVWFRNMWQNEKDRYNWTNSEAHSFAARESSLFHKHKPVVSYGYDELGTPMHNGTVSMWEMCAGLLGHVHFTLPLEKNSRGQYVPTTLKSSSRTAYSPYTPSNTPNLTALEDFIVQISRDAFEVHSHSNLQHSQSLAAIHAYMGTNASAPQISPFYRHYGMFHLASDSAGCPDYANTMQNSSSAVPHGSTYTFLQEAEAGHGVSSSYHLTSGSRLENATISRKGVLRGLLGAAPRHACFCGFDMIGEQCVLPANILGHILTSTLPPTADMTFLKTDIASIQGGRFFLHQN